MRHEIKRTSRPVTVYETVVTHVVELTEEELRTLRLLVGKVGGGYDGDKLWINDSDTAFSEQDRKKIRQICSSIYDIK